MGSPSKEKEQKEKVCFSVVICTKDRPNELNRCIASLLSQSYLPNEVIIVDDASIIPVSFKDFFKMNDKHADVNIKNKEMIDFTIVRNKKTQGIAISRNNGILQAKHDVTAFLDDDSFAHKDWLKNLAKNYNQKKVIGVGGPIIDLNRKHKVKRVKRLSHITANGKVILHNRANSLSQARKLPKSKVGFLYGGNMSFKREALEEIKGVDTKFAGTGYVEDTEMSFRLGKKGLITFDPKAVTYHKSALSGGNRPIENFKINNFLYWKFRNFSLFFIKHFGFRKGLKKIYASAGAQIKTVKKGETGTTRSFISFTSFPEASASVIKGVVSGVIEGVKSKIFKTSEMKTSYPESLSTAKVYVKKGSVKAVTTESPTLLESIRAGIKKIFIPFSILF